MSLSKFCWFLCFWSPQTRKKICKSKMLSQLRFGEYMREATSPGQAQVIHLDLSHSFYLDKHYAWDKSSYFQYCSIKQLFFSFIFFHETLSLSFFFFFEFMACQKEQKDNPQKKPLFYRWLKIFLKDLIVFYTRGNSRCKQQMRKWSLVDEICCFPWGDTTGKAISQ